MHNARERQLKTQSKKKSCVKMRRLERQFLRKRKRNKISDVRERKLKKKRSESKNVRLRELKLLVRKQIS